MITVTADDTIAFEKICDKILQLDPKIRFVGVISQHGKLQVGKKRTDVEFLVDDVEQEMLFMEVALRVRMRHEFDMSLGSVDFTISQQENVTVISMPYKDHVLYLSAENGIKLSIMHKILKLIRSLIR